MEKPFQESLELFSDFSCVGKEDLEKDVLKQIMDKNIKKEKNIYIDTAIEIGKLVESKQKKYGNSFGKSEEVLKVLYPNGIKPDQYKNLLTIIRILDKMFRMATSATDDEEYPELDICGYGLLAVINKEGLIK